MKDFETYWADLIAPKEEYLGDWTKDIKSPEELSEEEKPAYAEMHRQKNGKGRKRKW